MNCAVSLSLIGSIVLSAGSTLEHLRVPRPTLAHTPPPAGITVVTKTAAVNDRVGDAWPSQTLRSFQPALESEPKKVATIDPCGIRKRVYSRKGRSWKCR